jgi:dolichyl-diphosphooligosaccharide--protein glycosyltransferase
VRRPTPNAQRPARPTHEPRPNPPLLLVLLLASGPGQWFNFRATDYLATNGITKFLTWFDHEAWYPIGRPVGTTIYPGMQFTSVAIWHVLKAKVWRKIFGIPNVKAFLTFAGLRGGKDLLNDICVYVPAWFGAVASVTLGLLTREVSGSWRAGAAGALVMSVVPAHLMRSVGGGYDTRAWPSRP